MHPSTKGVRGRRHQVTPLESAGSWKQLQQRYVTSTLSLRALAREAAVSYDALKRRARRESWAAARAAAIVSGRREALREALRQPLETLRLRTELAIVTGSGVEPELVAETLRLVERDAARLRAVIRRSRR
jgi:hypothetical protein